MLSYIDTLSHLKVLMDEKYQTSNLKNVSASEFEENIRSKLGKVDRAVENYQDSTKQRDYSLKYYWGHDHDFGEWKLSGVMEDRHIKIIAYLVRDFGLPLDLSGKKVLDIGVWTGGTSLLLAAMGAKVTAYEEVKKYSHTVNYLAHAFAIDNLECIQESLYNVTHCDEFDYILYLGVIYHVTDPILSLRILYNSLKDNGDIFVETYGSKGDSATCVVHGGPRGG